MVRRIFHIRHTDCLYKLLSVAGDYGQTRCAQFTGMVPVDSSVCRLYFPGNIYDGLEIRCQALPVDGELNVD
jgi:hypothetical protein